MAKQKLIPLVVDKDGKAEKWDHYFIDAQSGVIYFLKSHNGKKIKFSTKCRYIPPDIDETGKAKRIANTEFDKRSGKKKRAVGTLINEELELWLKVKEAEGLKYDTMNNIKRGKTQIAEYWGEMLPSEIHADNLVKWYDWWKENHPDIDMENAIKYLRNFCKYLSEKVVGDRPLLPAVPTIRDPNARKIKVRRKKKKERIFTPEEFAIIRQTAANPDEELVVLIMYTMATRIDETLNMEFGRTILLDVDPPVYRWFFGQNKADLEGQHALHSELVPRLRELRARRIHEGTTLLFPQKIDKSQGLRAQQIDWDAWRTRANLSWHWTSHTMRHTCLTNLFDDPRYPDTAICKLYRVSLAVAMETYIKVRAETMLLLRDAIKLNLGSVAKSVRPNTKVEDYQGVEVGSGVPMGI